MRTKHIALLLALTLGAGTAFAQETKKTEPAKVKVKKEEAKPAPAPTPAPVAAPAAPKAKEAAASQPVASQPAAQPDIAPVKPPAGVTQVDPDDIGSLIKAIIESAKTGKWALLVGFIMMLLTWLVNKVLKSKIPTKVLPWLAIGLSTVTAVAFALGTGVGWINALVVGVQTGLMAAGSWSALGKYLPGIAKKAEPAPAEEAKP
jgi:hypothetical protein